MQAGHLKEHERLHSGDTPFVCPFDQCGYRTGYKRSLKAHIVTHECGAAAESDGPTPSTCTAPLSLPLQALSRPSLTLST